MRLLVLSDLHLEFGSPLELPADLPYDAAILAGDINSPGHRAVQWAKQPSTFGGRPVIYVPGNHEFYDREINAERQLMAESAEGSKVHLLHRQAVEIDGVRFLGATLWTDFACPIETDAGPRSDVAMAMAASLRFVVDYRAIHVNEAGDRRRLTPADTLAEHRQDLAWLTKELTRPCELPTVVVTHHGPSLRSVARRYAGDWVTGAFISDLPPMFFEKPALWVHGHTHTGFDYRQGNCRVVCNPRGYRMRDSSWENPGFLPLVVEVPSRDRLNGAGSP